MTSRPSGLLLLGASLVGKSTCAQAVARATGWPVISTDKLGRHPGRPWAGTPEPVMEFYLRMPDDAIHWFLRVHHENMRSVIGETIRTARGAGGFILEGAALRPEYLADWETGDALAVCLHVESQALRERIEGESGYAHQDERMKTAIERFVERCIRENDVLVTAAIKHEVLVVDVTDPREADRLAEALAGRIGPKGD